MMLSPASLPHALQNDSSMEMIQEEDESPSSLQSSMAMPQSSPSMENSPSINIPVVQRRQVDMKMSVRRRS